MRINLGSSHLHYNYQQEKAFEGNNSSFYNPNQATYHILGLRVLDYTFD
jgi:hypothetical protein